MRRKLFTILAVSMLGWASGFLVADFAAAQGATSQQYVEPQRDELTTERVDDNLVTDTRRDAADFRCAEIVEISRSAARDQYNFSAARLEECLAREVIGDTKGRLADTGGPPLLPIAALLLIGAGIFVGRSVFSRRDR